MVARVGEERGLLARLPTELILNLYDELEPSSHFALATTCKLLYARSTPILEIHRNAHRHNRVISDCSLELLVRVYRSAQASVGSKAIEAWHVRKFEIWGSRETWDEWKSWEIDADGSVSLAAHEDPLPSPFGPREVADHIKERELMFHPTNDHEIIAYAFEDGEDGYFKAMIVSMLPRLNDLVFVSHHVSKQMLTLNWLEQMIQWSLDCGFPWPPGFNSLRKVSVGVPVFDRPEIEAVSRSMSLCTLLRLPSIEEIYYRNLSSGEPDESDGGWLLPLETSTVRTLVLDRIREDNTNLRGALVHTSIGLDAMVIRAQSGEPLDLVNTFPEELSSSVSQRSLRQFLLYQPDCMFGYHCRNYELSELSSMRNIRMIQLCVEDLLMECFCLLNGACCNDTEMEYYFDQDPFDRDNDESVLPERAPLPDMPEMDWKTTGDRSADGAVKHDDVVTHFTKCLPPTLEVLLLWGLEDEVWYNRGDYEVNEALDDAVVALINSRSFPNLRAIYLEQVEKQAPIPRTKISFQKTMIAAKGRGVYVRTLSNQHEPIPELGFPRMPDKYDLETGPFPARDPTWIFDPFTGSWTAPGCGGCGSCETCLRYYTKEAWEEFRRQKSDGSTVSDRDDGMGFS
ncbi:unnamed protein product [Clonostachys solani]|uniref:F-box domain-containing protein n=1 Tax=Clonostachys solani TaxID=160281 RepID=A0A9P0EQG0_9HYPO|nr:unnamed protein product [Clonostachys solani]